MRTTILTQTQAANERQALAEKEEGETDNLSESSDDEEMKQEKETEDRVQVNSNQCGKEVALRGPVKSDYIKSEQSE